MGAEWLEAVAKAWEARFGDGSFPWGFAGKTLKPLVEFYTGEEIAANLTEYLAKTDADYVSLPRFKMTFKNWTPQPVVNEFGEIVGQ